MWVISALWPLVLLAPLLPGLPTQTLKGFPWRQEIVLALLLSLTLALLARRSRRTGAGLEYLALTELRTLFPLTLFVFWSAASILWAASTFPAIHHTLVWGAYLLFFFMLCRAARSPRLVRSSIITLGVVIAIISISCLVEFWGSSHLLIRSSTGLGEPLAVAIPIFTALALKLRRTRAAVFCGAIALLAWLAVLQSLERAPAIGVSLALFILLTASFFRQHWRPRLSRALVLLLLFGGATALQTLPSPLTQDRPSFVTRLQTATGANDPNTSVRLLTWAVGFEMWRARPLLGVGANNYDTAFAEARARFSASHANSGLVALMEERLVERAHNEYIQILAELGLIGFALFLGFCLLLMLAAWRVLRRAQSPLALGAVCSLVVFALSSGASSVSFRWLGSGLVFFFAAAFVSHFAAQCEPGIVKKSLRLTPAFAHAVMVSALLFSLLMLFGRGAQATNAVLQGMAESAASDERVEQLYERALLWNPLDATTHFNYGMWLYLDRRAPQAIEHLRYAVTRGYNSSVCYAYLAAAEAGAGEMQAAARTLAEAVRVYPRSVFLRVRHAAALSESGQISAANEEYAAALSLNSRAARGWRQLICFGRKAAKTAAFYDKSIAMPGELSPENCIFAVLDENERRQPGAVLEERPALEAAVH